MMQGRAVSSTFKISSSGWARARAFQSPCINAALVELPINFAIKEGRHPLAATSLFKVVRKRNKKKKEQQGESARLAVESNMAAAT
jgi:hypothetical protein